LIVWQWLTFLGHPVQCGPKNLHIIFVRLNFMWLNFIIYWPIFKPITMFESGENFE